MTSKNLALQSISSEPGEILVSSSVNSDIRLQLGKAHYSYSFVARQFTALLSRMGYNTLFITEPQRPKYKINPDLARPIHIAFRSTAELRRVSGAINICHFAWEFDVMKSHNLPSEPIIFNQVHMLSLFDEIWAPSNYTRDILIAHGLNKAQLVPTPVCHEVTTERMSRCDAIQHLSSVELTPLCISSYISENENVDMIHSLKARMSIIPSFINAIRDSSRVFLIICNPGDLRKNLLNVIDGFRMAKREGDILIVKLIVPNEFDHLATVLYRHLQALFRSPFAIFEPSVYVMTQYLDVSEMHALYNLVDFYISAPLCEGYNLPLLEAMANGVVPISNCVTAMTDYITPENAVLIETKPYSGFLTGMGGDVAGQPYNVNVASRYDIARAITIANDMSRENLETLQSRAVQTVRSQYSFEVIQPIVERRLTHLSNMV